MSEWWREFFDEDYLKVYRKRDTKTTDREVAFTKRTLRLRPGQHVLDICCGYGRHAIRLVTAGLQVTGIDLSKLFIERARRAARRRGVSVNWVVDDIRTTKVERTFDAAYNLFTSIGYFEAEEDNYRIVACAAAALKPGGRFLLDTINRDRIIRNPQSQHWAPVGRGVELEKSEFDWERGRLNSQRVLVMDDGRRRETTISLRLYTVAELRAMFERAGFERISVFGSFAGTAFEPDAPRIIIVGHQPGSQRRTARRRDSQSGK